MFECSCGKTYKYASCLTNHKEKCGGGGAAVEAGGVGAAAVGGGGGAAAMVAGSEPHDPNDIAKSPFFTIPLTSFQPTANFTKEDLEMLEKRKQARLKAILQSQKEQEDKEKQKKITASTKFVLQQPKIPVAKYAETKQFFDNVVNEYSDKIVLKN